LTREGRIWVRHEKDRKRKKGKEVLKESLNDEEVNRDERETCDEDEMIER